jgi:hypothetical protein
MGKMTISTAIIKVYANEQRTMDNERYSKQTQSKPISNAETVQWCEKSHPIHESLPGVKQDFFFFSSFVFLVITFCCIENYLLFMLSIILGRFGRP